MMTYRSSGRSGPPAWLVIIAGALLVFGAYFIWIGVRDYLSGSIALSVQPTQNAGATVAANPFAATSQRVTPLPTRTPLPDCQDFLVIVPEAIVRECSSTNCPIADIRREGAVVCVLDRDPGNAEWFVVDLDDSPFFAEFGYMHESLLRPLNPTLTPSMTMTPMPTLTPLPTDTPLPTPLPSATPDPATSSTPTPTFTASPTPPLVSG